ncbi:hypothetical protein, partial [Schleiferia thermophila]|uniref:hypothetical protein n=1 Tax=Schleiferia thermophila TaxID=884107 RepID=UPI003EECAB75
GQGRRTHAKQKDKGLDYRIGLSGAVSKPPCGAAPSWCGTERQGQSKFMPTCRGSDCMVWV